MSEDPTTKLEEIREAWSQRKEHFNPRGTLRLCSIPTAAAHRITEIHDLTTEATQ
ncbi:hypothetical protein [Arthrobacter burdickii]|uniref:Transposase n=1 Tax=Arthrobacter burdickii TaxID=3035920 RepID=A0ABT8K3C7_9MICC|nr:hypothetical protein [Arthrobacter burdickii]MDN4611930.1 hypothetical protein [Arthrobacter burdickii]